MTWDILHVITHSLQAVKFQTQPKWVSDEGCGSTREKERSKIKKGKWQLSELLQFSNARNPAGRQRRVISSLGKNDTFKLLTQYTWSYIKSTPE